MPHLHFVDFINHAEYYYHLGPLMRLVLVRSHEEEGSLTNPNNFVTEVNIVWCMHHAICDYLSAMNTMFKLVGYLDKPPKEMHPELVSSLKIIENA